MPASARSSGMPVRMCFEKYHQCGFRSRATSSPSLMRCLGYGIPEGYGSRRRPPVGALSDRAEYPVEVGVPEPALGIHLGAHRLEAPPLRVAGGERLRRLPVHLPPVRP